MLAFQWRARLVLGGAAADALLRAAFGASSASRRPARVSRQPETDVCVIVGAPEGRVLDVPALGGGCSRCSRTVA